MTNLEFVKTLKYAESCKTLYVYGCFGAPMNEANKKRYSNYLDYNKKPERKNMILSATPDTFGFDCVCLVKGILWGWIGDVNAEYGGAKYKSNDVPDVGTDKLIALCKDVSTDFSGELEIGELVWMNGHVGVYVGEHLVIECSPAWNNGVQYSACNYSVEGYPTRTWLKHGKLPYIEYIKEEPVKKTYQFKVGDIVVFKGARYYYSTNDFVGSPTAKNQVIIIKELCTGLHSYKCNNYNDTMFGYVDEYDIELYVKPEVKEVVKAESTTKVQEVKQTEVKVDKQTSSKKQSNKTPKYKVGDFVEFIGFVHYANEDAKLGKICLPGKAQVTKIAEGSKHPYHLIRLKNCGTRCKSTVWGWVDENKIREVIK